MGMDEISVVEVRFVIKNIETYEEYKQLRKALQLTNLEEVAAKIYLETIEQTPALTNKLGIKVELKR